MIVRGRIRDLLHRAHVAVRLGPDGLRLRSIAALHAVAFVVLVVAALRTFLAGDGLIIYHNLAWPVSGRALVPINSVYVPDLWTNNGPDPGGYLRTPIDAPAIWLGAATGSPVTTEKLFLVYAFGLEYVLAAAAATLFLRWYPSGLVGGRRELVRLGFVVLLFVNPAALQWAAGDLLPFFWAAPLLEIALLTTLLGLRSPRLRYPLVAGVALGVAATLDPRLFVWGGFALAGIYGFALLVRQDRFALVTRAVVSAAVSLPSVALTFWVYAWAGLSTTPVRPATVPLIAWLSTNAGPLRLFELLGYFITEITYAPPSVYAYGAPGSLPALGSPTYAVVPPDPIAALWLVALAALPILAFGALLFRNERRYTLPFATLALAAIGFAGGTQVPLPGAVGAEVALGTLPGIGAAWQTVVGVPIYLQVVTEAAYVPLVVIATLGLVRWMRRFDHGHGLSLTWIATRELHLQVHVRPRPRPTRSVAWSRGALAFVVAVLLLGSWQFATGAYYPGGYSVGTSPTGVPTIGSSAPVVPAASDVAIMSTLAADPAPYAVYWPGATGFTYAWSPRSTPAFSPDGAKPLVEPAGMAYAVSHNLTADTAALLTATGARYVIVDNMSPLELVREFGTPSLAQIVAFFEASPGLTLVTADPPDSWEFAVASAPGIVDGRAGAVVDRIPADLSGPVVAALDGLGLHPAWLPSTSGESAPALVVAGTNATAGASSAVTVYTATNLSEIAPPFEIEGFVPGVGLAPSSYDRGTPGEASLPAPYANWSLSVWSLPTGTVNLTVDPSIGLTFSHVGSAATASLNYLSSLVTGSTAGIAVDPSSSVSFDVRAELRAEPGTTASGLLNVVASNATGINLEQLNSPTASPGPAWTSVSLTGVLPLGTSYFTLRLFTTLSGAVDVRNVSIAWDAVGSDPQAFGGGTIPLAAGRTLEVPVDPTGTYDVAVSAAGGGTLAVNGVPATASGTGSAFGWRTAPNVPISGTLALASDANLSVAGLVVFPDALRNEGPCTVAAETGSGLSDVDLEVGLGSNCSLLLHQPWVAHWGASRLDGGTAVGTFDAWGQTLFDVGSGAGSVAIALVGEAAFPYYLAAVAAFTAVVLVAAVVLPARWVTLPRRRRGRR